MYKIYFIFAMILFPASLPAQSPPPTPERYKKPVDENYPPAFIHPLDKSGFWEHRFDTYVPAQKYPVNYPNIHPKIGYRLAHTGGKFFNVVPGGNYRYRSASSSNWTWTIFETVEGKTVKHNLFNQLKSEFDQKYLAHYFDQNTKIPIYQYGVGNRGDCDFIFPVLGHLYKVEKIEKIQEETGKAILLDETTTQKLLNEYKSHSLLPEDAEGLLLHTKMPTFVFPLTNLSSGSESFPISGSLNESTISVISAFSGHLFEFDSPGHMPTKVWGARIMVYDSSTMLDKMDQRKDIRDPSPLKDYRQYTLGDIVKVGDVGYRLVNIVPPKKGNTALGTPREYYVCGWIELDATPIPLDENGEPIEKANE